MNDLSQVSVDELLRLLPEEELQRLVAGGGGVEERTPPLDDRPGMNTPGYRGKIDRMLSGEPPPPEDIDEAFSAVSPATGAGGVLGGGAGWLATRLGRMGLGAARGGGIAKRAMDTAVKSGEMIPAEKAATAVQTATQRGALVGGKRAAAEEALTGPGTQLSGGQLQVPIDKIDILRRIGGKMRGANTGEGKMLVAGAKTGLEEAGTPNAMKLLQALSDYAVRQRLTSGFTSPLSLIDILSAGTAKPGLALWRANKAMRPNARAENVGAGVGAGAGAGLSHWLEE